LVLLNQRVLILFVIGFWANLLFFNLVEAQDKVELSGDLLRIALPVMALGMTYAHDDQDGRYRFYKTLLATAAITYGLKLTVAKKPPDGNGESSFPSGHASIAFAGAAFMERRYGWQYGLPAYIAAGYVGYTRVVSDNHYVEDVLAGAAIGVCTAYYFTISQDNVIQVVPTFSRHGCGLQMRLTW